MQCLIIPSRKRLFSLFVGDPWVDDSNTAPSSTSSRCRASTAVFLERNTSPSALQLPSGNSFEALEDGDANNPSVDIHISGSSFADVHGNVNVHMGDLNNYHTQKISIDRSRTSVDWPTLLRWVSPGAAYDSQERNPPARCMPGTRVDILGAIMEWIHAADDWRLLWLHGPAGAGKSAIAQTVAETCAKRGQLAASFFFSRSATGRDTMKFLFPTVAVQIALSSEEKHRELEKILKVDPYIFERATGAIDVIVQLCRKPQIPCRPLSTTGSPFVVIIDALDECRKNDDQALILSQIFDVIAKHDLPLRFLIASRPEPHILEALEEGPASYRISICGDYFARWDVSQFLRTEFSRIHDSKRHQDTMCFIPKPWPSDDVIEELVDRSGGYFIYASTVIKFVDEEYFPSCTDRLAQVLGTFTSMPNMEPFAELDKLYIQILSSYPKSQLPLLKTVLGLAGFSLTDIHLSLPEIERFLCLQRGQVMLMLRGLHSLIEFSSRTTHEHALSSAPDAEFQSSHASFLDFLRDRDRSDCYYIDSDEWRSDGFRRGLSALREYWRSSPNAYSNNSANGTSKVYCETLACLFRDCATGQSAAAKLVHDTVRSDDWSTSLLTSGYWTDETKFQALELLTGMITDLVGHDGRELAGPDQDLVKELTLLRDAAFHSHLMKFGDCAEKIQCFQTMCTFDRLAIVALHEYKSGAIRKILSLPNSMLQTADDVDTFISLVRNRWCLVRYFIDFWEDKTRSGIFYTDPQVRHSFVANRCLGFLTTVFQRSDSFSALDKDELGVIKTAIQSVTWHLDRAIRLPRAHSRALMNELRVFGNLTKDSLEWMAPLEIAFAVIQWLENLRDPATEEMLPLWKSFVLHHRRRWVTSRHCRLWLNKLQTLALAKIEKENENNNDMALLPFYGGTVFGSLPPIPHRHAAHRPTGFSKLEIPWSDDEEFYEDDDEEAMEHLLLMALSRGWR